MFQANEKEIPAHLCSISNLTALFFYSQAGKHRLFLNILLFGKLQNRIHVTEKPLQLMKDVIQICEPGGKILDPFAGAGTTVLAAVEEGYETVGIEVTDAYYKLGSDRVRFALEAKEKEDSEK